MLVRLKPDEIDIKTLSVSQILELWKPPVRKNDANPFSAKISEINSFGQVTINFSKFIMIPEYFLNLTLRQETHNYTEIIQNIIGLKVNPYKNGKGDTYDILQYNLTDFEADHIVINVTFKYPNLITQNLVTPDQLEAQILMADYFIAL